MEESEAIKKLGYPWYYQDYWASRSFIKYRLNREIRCLYRDAIDVLYAGAGLWVEDREYYEGMFGPVTEENWAILKSLFVITEGPGNTSIWSHESIDKKITRSSKQKAASAENGKKGGRPKTQETQENNLRDNPPKPKNLALLSKDKIREDKISKTKPLKEVEVLSYQSLLAGQKDTAESRRTLLRGLLLRKYQEGDEGCEVMTDESMIDELIASDVNEDEYIGEHFPQMAVRIAKANSLQFMQMVFDPERGLKEILNTVSKPKQQQS